MSEDFIFVNLDIVNKFLFVLIYWNDSCICCVIVALWLALFCDL